MYAATIEGQALTFYCVSVFRRNMVLADRETGSLWQQATGECLAGPLKGKQMELIGGELRSWGAWKAEYPASTLAEEPAVWSGLLPRARIVRLLEAVTSRIVCPGGAPLDRRLPPHEMVCGIVIAGEARAYPLDLLRSQRTLTDQLGGQEITIEHSPQGDQVRAYLGAPRAQVEARDRQRTERQFWLGWVEFHPGTGVYQPRVR